MEAFWLVLIVMLGGAGLILAMPGGRLNSGLAALVVLLGAAGAVSAELLRQFGALPERHIMIALALLGLWGGVRVITHSKPVYSALYFILVVISVAGMLVLMSAEFLSTALVVIYAGAILVTYVFVIMLAQQSTGPATYDRIAREPLIGVLSGLILLGVIAAQITAEVPPTAGPETTALPGTTSPIGTHLLTYYAVAVEVAGVLLLAAMVGAIAIARRRTHESETAA